MSAVAVIRYLLSHNTPLNAVVPAARIKAGDLPIGTTIPAISVKSVSSVRRNTVGMSETKTLVSERVQVTLTVNLAADQHYPLLTQGLRLIRQACPNQRGTFEGVDVDSVLPESEGPDLEGPTPESIQRSQDFMVRWRENR